MKTKLSIVMLFITSIINAQTVITFESLNVPTSGFFNGSTQYTGSGNQETITYEEADGNFHVNYTDTGTYDYWSAFSYTNQTDLISATYTNYSAYSTNGGGSNGSANYVIAYLYGEDEITFDNEVNIASIDIANSVWTYHYMNGSDGSGTGTYTTGDYFNLTITGVLANGNSTTPIVFKLADFNNGNSIIVDDWTTIDLSSFGAILGLKFQVSAADNYTPYYFCLDNIVYDPITISTANFNLDKNITVYPNPANDFVKIVNIENANIAIIDINGRIVFYKENCINEELISLKLLNSGIYFVKIEKETSIEIKKLVIK